MGLPKFDASVLEREMLELPFNGTRENLLGEIIFNYTAYLTSTNSSSLNFLEPALHKRLPDIKKKAQMNLKLLLKQAMDDSELSKMSQLKILAQKFRVSFFCP